MHLGNPHIAMSYSCQSCLGRILVHTLMHIDVVWFLAFLQVEEVDILDVDVESSTDLDQVTMLKVSGCCILR